MVVDLICGIFLAGAVWQDWKSRKIKNVYNVSGCVAGIVCQALWGEGLVMSLKGMGAGLAAGFVLYLLGAVKAGDGKTMCAMGAFLGTKRFAAVLICSLLAGGAMSLAILLMQKDGKKRLLRLKEYGKSLLYLRTYRRYEAETPYEFPFAICLGVGYLVSFSVCGNLIK